MVQIKSILVLCIKFALALNNFSGNIDSKISLNKNSYIIKIYYSVFNEKMNQQKYVDLKKININTINCNENDIYQKIFEFCNGNFIYGNFFTIAHYPHHRYKEYCLIVGYTESPLELRYSSNTNIFSDKKDFDLFNQEIDALCDPNHHNRCYFFLPITYVSSQLKLVSTEKGVMVSKKFSMNKQNMKEINLTMALRSYFLKGLDCTDFINALAKSRIGSSSELSERQLNKEGLNLYHVKRITLDSKEYDYLQNSTILAVWKVISHEKESVSGQKKIIESEFMGLLKDDCTNQLFYFNYDLGQDISVLLNYPSKEKTEN